MLNLTREQLFRYSPTNNMVLIKPSRGENKYTLPNGVEIKIDIQFEQEIHAPVSGTIIAVPKNIYPGDFTQPGMQWETDMEVEPNDFAVYSYLSATVALDPAYGQMIVCEGELYLLIPYEEIFVVRRYIGKGQDVVWPNKVGGESTFGEWKNIEKIIPVNGYCLIEPMEDEKVNSVLLQTEGSKRPSTIYGRVAHLSKSLIRRYVDGDGNPDTDNISVGDIVTFDNAADLPVQYPLHASLDGNKTFYRIQRRYITGKFTSAIGK